MPEPTVALEGIRKQYGDALVLKDVSLEVLPGEFFTLLGPSGCGKTTMLRVIAGLAVPDTGRVRLDGRDITALPPHLRQMGMVFQQYALFPHLSAWDNVAYGLRARRLNRSTREERARHYLELVGLLEHARRKPKQLSGGQQQRVALARALAVHPRVLLFDEPLSNLDAELRLEMQEEIRKLHAELRFTGIYVTHDHQEALRLSDRICVLDAGRVQQVGRPDEVFLEPANPVVARYFGYRNALTVRLESRGGRVVCRLPDGKAVTVGRVSGAADAGARGVLMFHPAQVFVTVPAADAAGKIAEGELQARVRSVVHLGTRWETVLEFPWGDTVQASQAISGEPLPAPGNEVRVGLVARGPSVFVEDRAGGMD